MRVHLGLTIFATLAACGPVDADFDGFAADVDCDDLNPAISPAAAELCDGVDQDCDGVVDNEASGGFVYYVDQDADGHGSLAGTAVACLPPAGFVANAADCDDARADIFPGADELCDGADQDCDGALDEDAVDAPLWYADWDVDGFGSATRVERACEMPAGFVSIPGDCNDFDLHVRPGATERCDYVDNNCDGATDEPEAEDVRTWYRDQDGDGHGDLASPTLSCWLPGGYTASDADCNDLSSNQSPDLDERCRDGVDNNCNSSPDQCTVAAWTSVANASRTYQGRTSFGYLGYDVKVVGDVDGDGIDDMLAGAWNDNSGTSGQGGSFLVYGSESAPSVSPEPISNHPVFAGDGFFAYAGRAVAPAGDVDGDGFDDMLIGAWNAGSGAGRVHLVYGRSTRFSGRVDLSSQASWLGPASANLGYAMTGGVDLDGDGFDDILLGAQRENSWGGTVYLNYGRSTRWTGSTNARDSAAWLTGPTTSDYLGSDGTMGDAGDFDGDGLGDVVLGAWRADGGGMSSGQAWILYGDVTRRAGGASVGTLPDRIDGAMAWTYFGSGNGSVGDVNGDGYEDVGIGCYGCNSFAGGLYLYYGSATRPGVRAQGAADVVIRGSSSAQLGRHAPTHGDYDGDGTDDLAIGGPFSTTGSLWSHGSVLVVAGSSSLPSEIDGATEADARIAGPSIAYAYFGRGLGSGDVNGDGLDDLVAGAERAGSNQGVIYVFEGTSL